MGSKIVAKIYRCHQISTCMMYSS